ncbi:MAG: Hpt domain-containing protein [Candidatus Acidiferrales bacterium]
MKNSEESISEQVWNLPELHERVENDQELLRELVTIFRRDFPRTIRSLEEAVAAGDLKNSASLSHALKGMLANLGAARAAAAAAMLEKMASSAGEETSLKNALNALQREAASLLPELDAYMKEVRR